MTTPDQPFSLVIFGASGDLARRKLIPALWSLYAGRTLPDGVSSSRATTSLSRK